MASVAHASESGDEVDVDTGELSSEYFDAPLQLSDIMPKNRRLYDKMRPPKFKGKSGNMKKGYHSHCCRRVPRFDLSFQQKFQWPMNF